MSEKKYEGGAERQKAYRERHRNADRNAGGTVTVENVTVEEMPFGADPKLWAGCLERADRARKYALKFPEQITPGQEKFQSPLWQYEQEVR